MKSPPTFCLKTTQIIHASKFPNFLPWNSPFIFNWKSPTKILLQKCLRTTWVQTSEQSSELNQSPELRVQSSEFRDVSEFRVQSSEMNQSSEFRVQRWIRVQSSEFRVESEFRVQSSEMKQSSEFRVQRWNRVQSSEFREKPEFRVQSSDKRWVQWTQSQASDEKR